MLALYVRDVSFLNVTKCKERVNSCEEQIITTWTASLSCVAVELTVTKGPRERSVL